MFNLPSKLKVACQSATAVWDREFPLDTSLEVLRGLALALLYDYRKDSSLYESIRERDWPAVVEFTPDYALWDPLGLTVASSHWQLFRIIAERQAKALFEKLEPLPLGIDKEQIAFARFQEDESKCAETNRHFREVRRGSLITDPRVSSVLFTATRKISRILGDVPFLSDLRLAFGPGANTTCKMRTTARHKLSSTLACSHEMVQNLSEVLHELPLLSDLNKIKEDFDRDSVTVEVLVTPGQLTFVPKNAKTYRSIVIEPLLNTLVQKGVGTYLKGRLMRAGCNLYDQSHNQLLALRGSSGRSRLATIDLSSASDTISKEVVADLLPLDWFSFLSRYRTGTVSYNGKSYKLEKFSSMGNAFTFELESLIFYALTLAVCEVLHLPTDEVSVYGDDIIAPVAATELLYEVLEYCGFSVNKKKSFSTGHFRESCGSDFLHGKDIRPYYQKELVSGRSLFVLHNFLVRKGNYAVASLVEDLLNPSIRTYGPDGYGDGHLLAFGYEKAYGVQKLEHRNRGWHGHIFHTFVSIPRRFKKRVRGDTILPFYVAYVSEGDSPSDPYVIRGSRGYRKLSIYTLA